MMKIRKNKSTPIIRKIFDDFNNDRKLPGTGHYLNVALFSQEHKRVFVRSSFLSYFFFFLKFFVRALVGLRVCIYVCMRYFLGGGDVECAFFRLTTTNVNKAIYFATTMNKKLCWEGCV